MPMTDFEIPTIDFAPFRAGGDAGKRDVARQIDEACRDIGFFTIVGHGVSEDLVAATRQEAIDFFALPEAEKLAVERPPQKISRGYFKICDRSLSYSLGAAAPPDIQEGFAFGPELTEAERDGAGPALAANIWPQNPASFRPTMVAYYQAMTDLAVDLNRAMALALGVDENYFLDKFGQQSSVARMIRYPALTETPLPGQLRAGAHTDYGMLTFVRGDDTPGGLQVKHRHGDWLDVHPAPHSFVCNIGDLMMRWSNDRWVSTVHRVAVPPESVVSTDRISLVFFRVPHPDTMISCIPGCAGPGGEEKYPPITCAEHYFGKLMKSGHHRLDAKAAEAVAEPA
jgi:isopenicillin N synthase-like dioxygenase